jgi:chaperonin GroEL
VFQKEHAKSKTAAKTITYDISRLKGFILKTMQIASKTVGSTLGPNGKIVLIERQENLPPFATKDGITVFNSMAFSDPTMQAILEAARDSSSKTNAEAGDGTTTATILAEALIRLGFEYLAKNPKVSAQKVMRELETAYSTFVQPFIEKTAVKITNDNDGDLLKKVAMIATNYDDEMASAVIECFKRVGHGGNVTIVEAPGVSGFEVEKIEGFPIARGFEDSCGRFLEEFINDRGAYRTLLEKPHFFLYNGKINDINTIFPLLEKIADASDPAKYGKNAMSPNLVVVAHHFSEAVLATLASNFKNPGTINVLPLKIPVTYQANSGYHFLQDLAAFTSSVVFDPLTKTAESAELRDLGTDKMELFEFSRYRSTIIGRPEEITLMPRAEELTLQMAQAESSYDKEILNERLALLTGGIAKIKVLGSSEAELKEKRHRVEDAVAAIKGAIRSGVLPGCAKTLLIMAYMISQGDYPASVKEILGKAFVVPFKRILENGGNKPHEIEEVSINILFKKQKFWDRFTKKSLDLAPMFRTYDAMNFRYGDAVELGILDSAAAVGMAIKNSLSVSKMLMGLSGIVVFQRDRELELREAQEISNEQRAVQEALADEERATWEPNF